MKNKLIFTLSATLSLCFLFLFFNDFFSNDPDNDEPINKLTGRTIQENILSVENKIENTSVQQINTLNGVQSLTKIDITDSTNENEVNKQKDDFILKCEDGDLEEQESQTENIFTYWEQSAEPHVAISHSIFSNDTTMVKATTDLLNYHQKYPFNKIAYERLINACSADNFAYCTESFFEKAQIIDSDNGTLSLRIASHYLGKKDLKRVEKYINLAANQARFNTYFFELSKQAWLSLQGFEGPYISKSIESAIGFVAAMGLHSTAYLNYCKEEIKTHSQMADSCYRLGKAMNNVNSDLWPKLIGLRLQEMYAEVTNNKLLAKSLKKQSSDISKNSYNEKFMQVHALMLHDTSLIEPWLNNAINLGEEKAQNLLIEEAIWRSKDPNYNPCKSFDE